MRLHILDRNTIDQIAQFHIVGAWYGIKGVKSISVLEHVQKKWWWIDQYQETKLYIPSGNSFNSMFGDPCPYMAKILYLMCELKLKKVENSDNQGKFVSTLPPTFISFKLPETDKYSTVLRLSHMVNRLFATSNN